MGLSPACHKGCSQARCCFCSRQTPDLATLFACSLRPQLSHACLPALHCVCAGHACCTHAPLSLCSALLQSCMLQPGLPTQSVPCPSAVMHAPPSPALPVPAGCIPAVQASASTTWTRWPCCPCPCRTPAPAWPLEAIASLARPADCAASHQLHLHPHQQSPQHVALPSCSPPAPGRR